MTVSAPPVITAKLPKLAAVSDPLRVVEPPLRVLYKAEDKLKLMLFRIIQEQVNNVLKHAAAKNLIIELILEEGENCIGLTITDDGKGFHPDKIKNKKGLGLSNIMSRADLFGGKLTILSAPGEGCKLRVQVPVL